MNLLISIRLYFYKTFGYIRTCLKLSQRVNFRNETPPHVCSYFNILNLFDLNMLFDLKQK